MNLYIYAYAAVASVFALWIFYRSGTRGLPINIIALLGVIYPVGLFMQMFDTRSFWPGAFQSFGLVPLVAVTWIILWPVSSNRAKEAIRLATVAATTLVFFKLVMVGPVLVESFLVLLSYLLTVMVLRGYYRRIRHAEKSLQGHTA